MLARVILGDSRKMYELNDESVDLVVTSPPYWHLKDYEASAQIGYGQSLHEYLMDLYQVWSECFRVLKKGGRLCINVGDQFARAIIYGNYKVIPLHAEIILQGEKIGFDYMGSIIWQKKTTMNTTGGAVVMGSFPYPPNGLIEIDYEFILIFKKPGKSKKVSPEIKELSKLSKEEWKEYFSGHWRFGGAKQIGHEAMFPEELPRRLIKMFTFVGDTVLDPFLGSGTTAKVALELKRNVVGYEINKSYLGLIKEKIRNSWSLFEEPYIEIVERANLVSESSLFSLSYTPNVKDMKPYKEINEVKKKNGEETKVIKILKEDTVLTSNGQAIKFLGVEIEKKEETLKYLEEYLLNKKIIIKEGFKDRDVIEAYVYLKNGIFINSYLIRSGLGKPDLKRDYKYKNKFIELWRERKNA